MVSRKRTKMLQNASKQIPATTPAQPANTKDKPILVDKTNQIITVRALRNRKVYNEQNTNKFVAVSKKLFENSITKSPKALSKKQTSTKRRTLRQKAAKCSVLEKVETNNQEDVVCKDSTEKQVAKKPRTVVRKNSKCPVMPEKLGGAKVNKDISPPNTDKQTATKKQQNVSQNSRECSVVVEKVSETKDQKKLVYEDVSPPSAERQKTFTAEKKIMLYDFKGGSGSSDNSSRKPGRKRKPIRKRIKPQSDTSDEENCGSENAAKKMKMLAACSQENQKDCTTLYSQTSHLSMNSSVQPLRDQNILPNQSVKSGTRKFFKTPVRKQFIEMSLFNYTNQKKKKFPKSSKTFSTKKEKSKSCRKKQNLLYCNSTQDKLDNKKNLPVVLSENRTQSKLGNMVSHSNIKIPEVVKRTTSNSKIPEVVKRTTSNSKIPTLVKPITSNNKIPPVKSAITSTIDPSTKSELKKVDSQIIIADKTEMACFPETMMDVDVSTDKELSAEEAAIKETLTESGINFKRGGRTFIMDFTLGESDADCSKQTDKSAADNQVQTTVSTNHPSIIPAKAAQPVSATKQIQVVDPTLGRKQTDKSVANNQVQTRVSTNHPSIIPAKAAPSVLASKQIQVVDSTLGRKQTDKSAANNQVQTRVSTNHPSIIPAKAAPSVPASKQIQVVVSTLGRKQTDKSVANNQVQTRVSTNHPSIIPAKAAPYVLASKQIQVVDSTLGRKQADKSAANNQVQTTVSTNHPSIIPAKAAPPVPATEQIQVVKDNTENNNYFTGPVRSLQFLQRYARKTKRHRADGLYVPAAPSTEHFTLENYFGFDEIDPEDEFILSPVKWNRETKIPKLPVTSTPHIGIIKNILPHANRLTVKPKVKEYQHKTNGFTSTSQINCSQILAGGGCGYKNKSSASSNSKTATFAMPQVWNVPAPSISKTKQTLVRTGSSMVQSSITDYMQSHNEVSCNVSEVPFDSSLSNIEGDELSITHVKPPRRSYERPVRNKRHVDDDYVSEIEEEKVETKKESRKHSRSKRQNRSKKEERKYQQWVSNVSSQFEEIDSMALLVE